MKPSEIIKKLQSKGISSAEIAKRAGCSVFYVNKIASGERENPSYQIVDRLRALYAEKAA
ncbi:helix-turn-helix domain-containing protein [Uruburuella suis]|jgi:transcriptional regulator with XRE-family HTH domain|uniref:helix-turn-helix domain-containing protein n=1 Tax=Uruburuella suis TaxID=252130 RepID=UPI00249211EB|nr:helix-turn-helix transcriptional regulator [Uruburuella suis]